jgi:hypothetical protein
MEIRPPSRQDIEVLIQVEVVFGEHARHLFGTIYSDIPEVLIEAVIEKTGTCLEGMIGIPDVGLPQQVSMEIVFPSIIEITSDQRLLAVSYTIQYKTH